jgi:hypothetical protein
VNFGGKPVEPPALDENGKPAGGPANRRAEMWLNLKTALQGRFAIPDIAALRSLIGRLKVYVGWQASPGSQGGHEEKRDPIS